MHLTAMKSRHFWGASATPLAFGDAASNAASAAEACEHPELGSCEEQGS